MAELIPDDQAVVPPRRGTAARMLEHLVTWWALAGGGVFVAIVIMSIVSIVGRKLFSSPIDGDMELLMMGAAVGSASFLAVCEMDDHHIKVDALTTWMSARGRAVLDVIAHGLLAFAAAILSWRTALYMLESHENMEVSPLLLVPIWQPVLLMVPSFVLLALAALYRTGVSFRSVIGGAQ